MKRTSLEQVKTFEEFYRLSQAAFFKYDKYKKWLKTFLEKNSDKKGRVI